MSFKFLGHGAMGGSLVIGDKVYQPGDTVPLSKESMLAHQRAGLSFEGVDEPMLVPTTEQAPADNRARDERGQVIEPKGKS